LGLQVPYVPVNDVQHRELAQTEQVCRFTAGPDSLPRLAVGVRAGNELLGSIWVVDAAEKLGPDAEQTLTAAANIAALRLLAARTASDHARHQRGDLLRRVLTDPASAALLAPQLGLSPDTAVAVAAFIVVSSDPDGALASYAAMRFTDLVSLHCEAHFGRHGCALIDGTVYALLPAHPSRHSHRDLVADIARRAQRALRVPIRAGLGSRVAGLRSAVMSRQEADLVLRVLADQQGEPGEPLIAAIEDVQGRPGPAIAFA